MPSTTLPSLCWFGSWHNKWLERWPSAQVSAQHRLPMHQRLSLRHTSCWARPTLWTASKWPTTHTAVATLRPSTWSPTSGVLQSSWETTWSGVSGVQFIVSFAFSFSLRVEIFPHSDLTFGNFLGTFWKSVQTLDIFSTLFWSHSWKMSSLW